MKKVLIVGSGYMAFEYAKVLDFLKIEFEIVGNRPEKIAILKESFPNSKCIEGGYEKYLQYNVPPQYVIIATPVEISFETTKAFILKGVKNILTEKPAGLCHHEINELNEISKEHEASISVAYNRRFYESIQFAKKIIIEDGGISSLHFEFTEWTHTIDQNKFPPAVLKKFLIANSSHVIDTVFHLIGYPKIINPIVSGNNIGWHPSGSIFCGSGVSIYNIPFTYHSNWGSPGRWSIEIITPLHRLYLKPMEKLSIQNIGSVSIEELNESYNLDLSFKPGLYMQIISFLNNQNKDILCSIEEHSLHFPYYEMMAGYNLNTQ